LRETPGQILRFVLVGGANTFLTGGIFLALSSVLGSGLAYTIAFVVGVVFALAVTPGLVFRTRTSSSQRIRYLLWYLMVYVFGLVVVYVLDDLFDLANTAVVLGTLAVTATLSFLGARFLFAEPSKRRS
jgi:putative flippase GtrA